MSYLKSVPKIILVVFLFDLILKFTFAGFIELGNDEVYYWTYSKFLDWSHFDHPPMVGLLIWVTTLGNLLQHDFFIRLGPILLGSISSLLVYDMMAKLKGKSVAIFAFLLFKASFFFNVLSGLFIMPDTPEMFFWVLAIYAFIHIDQLSKSSFFYWSLYGLAAGLAVLSKYHGIFIWFGVGIYIIFYKQKYFLSPKLYWAITLSVCMTLPILIWNLGNDFISYQFHSQRVTPTLGVHFDYLGRELIGQLLYQNPFVFVLSWWAVFEILKQIKNGENRSTLNIFCLLIGLPVILLFTGFAIFRETLPHWSGPGYFGLIILASIVLEPKIKGAKIAVTVVYVLMIISPIFFNYLPFNLGDDKVENLGEDDFSGDMYGWKETAETFSKKADSLEQLSIMPKNAPIVSWRWFPGAHIDKYVASPQGRRLFLIGNMDRIHKYAWINKARGGVNQQPVVYCLSLSNSNEHPIEYYKPYYNKIVYLDEFTIFRTGEPLRNVRIYKMFEPTGKFENPLNLKN